MLKFTEFLNERSKFDTTLQYHDQLNPAIWQKEKLDPKIHAALMRIAHDWAEFSRIPFSVIKDIILIGGNCNYNYTDFSDIDLHLVVDMNNIIKDPDILDDWLYDKKILWAKYHPNIRIKGYPVELYAQDEKQEPKDAQGIYSLITNKWISKPSKHDVKQMYSNPNLIRKIKYYAKQIDHMTSDFAYGTKEKAQQIKKLKGRLHQMRSSGIQKAGEFAQENLAYKALRNLGKINQLNDYLTNFEDKEYSVD
jgi:hypothetical protein